MHTAIAFLTALSFAMFLISFYPKGSHEMDSKKATLTEIRQYFGFTSVRQFKNEWTELSDADKAQLGAGIGDGSLTY